MDSDTLPTFLGETPKDTLIASLIVSLIDTRMRDECAFDESFSDSMLISLNSLFDSLAPSSTP